MGNIVDFSGQGNFPFRHGSRIKCLRVSKKRGDLAAGLAQLLRVTMRGIFEVVFFGGD